MHVPVHRDRKREGKPIGGIREGGVIGVVYQEEQAGDEHEPAHPHKERRRIAETDPGPLLLRPNRRLKKHWLLPPAVSQRDSEVLNGSGSVSSRDYAL